MVAAEGAGADDRDANGVGHGLLDGGFDGFTAARVEVEELSDGVFAFGGGGSGKAGGGTAGAGLDVGVRGEEFEQVERDVFGAAGGGGGGAGVHVGLSMSPLMVAGRCAGLQWRGDGREQKRVLRFAQDDKGLLEMTRNLLRVTSDFAGHGKEVCSG